ncbi:MAG: (2Fe-2S) ferredoxin domain-containing protein [Cyanobacteria bacterium J06635_1]
MSQVETSQVETSQVEPSQIAAKLTPKTMAASKGEFYLEGRFAGFAAGKKSPFKYLCLETTTGTHQIKLNKSLRLMLFRHLAVGDGVRVVGRQTLDKETEEPKLKAREVLKVDLPSANFLARPEAHPEQHSQTRKAQTRKAQTRKTQTRKTQKKAKILICQKSSCRKRGSQAICQALEAALGEAGLEGSVSIKLTGCMDRCKAGPNVVVMPDKTRYTRVTPKQISTLVSQHFCSNELPQ